LVEKLKKMAAIDVVTTIAEIKKLLLPNAHPATGNPTRTAT